VSEQQTIPTHRFQRDWKLQEETGEYLCSECGHDPDGPAHVKRWNVRVRVVQDYDVLVEALTLEEAKEQAPAEYRKREGSWAGAPTAHGNDEIKVTDWWQED